MSYTEWDLHFANAIIGTVMNKFNSNIGRPEVWSDGAYIAEAIAAHVSLEVQAERERADRLAAALEIAEKALSYSCDEQSQGRREAIAALSENKLARGRVKCSTSAI